MKSEASKPDTLKNGLSGPATNTHTTRYSVNVFKSKMAYEDDLLISSHMPFLL